MKNRWLALIFIALLGISALLFFSNYTLRILFSDKIWAHRVNSIEKLKSTESRFEGVELDLVFHSNLGKTYFDVNHPPSPSTGLSLSEYFQSQGKGSTLNYWLDIKNLTPRK